MAFGYKDFKNEDLNKHLTMWKSKTYADALEGVSFDDFRKFMEFYNSPSNTQKKIFIRVPDPEAPDGYKRIGVMKKEYGVKDAATWLNEQRGKSKKSDEPKAILIKKQKADVIGDSKPDVEIKTEVMPAAPMTDYEKDKIKRKLKLEPTVSDDAALAKMLAQQKRILELLDKTHRKGLL